MAGTGNFAPDARVELIKGEIIEISPIGSRHAAGVDLLTESLKQQMTGTAKVRIQNPIVLDDFSEPQPRYFCVAIPHDRYRNAHPRPEDIFLVVEVADTTIDKDRYVKIPLYAQGNSRGANLQFARQSA